MIIVTDINLAIAFRDHDYKKPFYQTTLKVQLGERYNRADMVLSDEQTKRIVDFILAVTSEGLSLELEQPKADTPIADEPAPHEFACLSKSDPSEIVL